MRIGTVSVVVKATTGASQYSHDAVLGATICLWNNFQRSRYGWNIPGPCPRCTRSSN